MLGNVVSFPRLKCSTGSFYVFSKHNFPYLLANQGKVLLLDSSSVIWLWKNIGLCGSESLNILMTINIRVNVAYGIRHPDQWKAKNIVMRCYHWYICRGHNMMLR